MHFGKTGSEVSEKKKENKVLKDICPLLAEKKMQYLTFTILSGFNYLVMIALYQSGSFIV